MSFRSNGGANPFSRGLRQHLEKMELVAPAALERAAVVLETNWKTILDTPGTGRFYGKHRASVPGAPPAPDTRELHDSIHHKPGTSSAGGRGRLGSGLARSVIVASDSEHAELTEFGTENMEPRPHARPAFAASLAGMNAEVVSTLKGA